MIRYSKKLLPQVAVSLICIVCLAVLINNVTVNLIRTGLGFNFSWLMRPASFALAEHLLPYSPSDNYAWALFMGWLNSLQVILGSLIIATILGFLAGLARISKNPLLKLVSAYYVTTIRQTPLLLQLMFWYFVGFLGIEKNITTPIKNLITISNQGIIFLGVEVSAEFSALLLGLSVFSGAYISEVVRGGINAVPKGQWEAFRSLGLKESIGMNKIVIPQALPIILPGLTSQYLNLAKNSTLAIAIGYADLYAVSDTVINQTGRAIEGFIILLTSFLILNLLISNVMEILNRIILRSQNNSEGK